MHSYRKHLKQFEYRSYFIVNVKILVTSEDFKYCTSQMDHFYDAFFNIYVFRSLKAPVLKKKKKKLEHAALPGINALDKDSVWWPKKAERIIMGLLHRNM